MLSSALVAVVLLAPAQAEAADIYIPSGEVFCDSLNEPALRLEPESVFQTLEAPTGGAWWIARKTDENITRFEDEDLAALVLINGAGDEVAYERHVTPGAFAIRVPEGASAGATFLLRPAGAMEGMVLRVVAGEVRPASFSLESLAQDTPRQASDCYADCYDPGLEQQVPRSPALAVATAGDPVIVDAWFKVDGTASSLELDRRVDSRLVEPGSAARLELGYELEGEVTATFIVEFRDPHTFELLGHEELTEPVLTKDFEPREANEDFFIPSCDEYDDCYDCYYGDGYVCGVAGGEVPWAFAFVLGALALVRRRRR